MSKTQRRRRREGKTDYYSRFALLKSGRVRIVVRRSNRYIIAQLVKSETAQDKVITQSSSKELLSKGWPIEKRGALKSLIAAYLTGYNLAKKYASNDKRAVLDAGLQRNIKGSRIYAVLKGAVDGGLKVEHSPDVLPSIENLKSDPEKASLLDKIKEKL